jgi:tRNA (guanine-N7-)-methyltransferase
MLEKVSSIEGEKKIYVEVGFGNGDFTIYLSKKFPEAEVVGIEISKKSIEKLKKKIEKEGIKNIRIIHSDAKIALSSFPDNSISAIFFNFPDPWWKRRHRKRRLFTADFISLLSKKLKSGGAIEIATDHLHYGGEIWRNFESSALFRFGFGNYPVLTFVLNKKKTKYEEKYWRMGKTILYMKFVKP